MFTYKYRSKTGEVSKLQLSFISAQRSGTEVVQSPYQGLEENLKRCKMHQVGSGEISTIYNMYINGE